MGTVVTFKLIFTLTHLFSNAILNVVSDAPGTKQSDDDRTLITKYHVDPTMYQDPLKQRDYLKELIARIGGDDENIVKKTYTFVYTNPTDSQTEEKSLSTDPELANRFRHFNINNYNTAQSQNKILINDDMPGGNMKGPSTQTSHGYTYKVVNNIANNGIGRKYPNIYKYEFNKPNNGINFGENNIKPQDNRYLGDKGDSNVANHHRNKELGLEKPNPYPVINYNKQNSVFDLDGKNPNTFKNEYKILNTGKHLGANNIRPHYNGYLGDKDDSNMANHHGNKEFGLEQTNPYPVINYNKQNSVFDFVGKQYPNLHKHEYYNEPNTGTNLVENNIKPNNNGNLGDMGDSNMANQHDNKEFGLEKTNPYLTNNKQNSIFDLESKIPNIIKNEDNRPNTGINNSGENNIRPHDNGYMGDKGDLNMDNHHGNKEFGLEQTNNHPVINYNKQNSVFDLDGKNPNIFKNEHNKLNTGINSGENNIRPHDYYFLNNGIDLSGGNNNPSFHLNTPEYERPAEGLVDTNLLKVIPIQPNNEHSLGDKNETNDIIAPNAEVESSKSMLSIPDTDINLELLGVVPIEPNTANHMSSIKTCNQLYENCGITMQNNDIKAENPSEVESNNKIENDELGTENAPQIQQARSHPNNCLSTSCGDSITNKLNILQKRIPMHLKKKFDSVCDLVSKNLDDFWKLMSRYLGLEEGYTENLNIIEQLNLLLSIFTYLKLASDTGNPIDGQLNTIIQTIRYDPSLKDNLNSPGTNPETETDISDSISTEYKKNNVPHLQNDINKLQTPRGDLQSNSNDLIQSQNFEGPSLSDTQNNILSMKLTDNKTPVKPYNGQSESKVENKKREMLELIMQHYYMNNPRTNYMVKPFIRKYLNLPTPVYQNDKFIKPHMYIGKKSSVKPNWMGFGFLEKPISESNQYYVNVPYSYGQKVIVPTKKYFRNRNELPNDQNGNTFDLPNNNAGEIEINNRMQLLYKDDDENSQTPTEDVENKDTIEYDDTEDFKRISKPKYVLNTKINLKSPNDDDDAYPMYFQDNSPYHNRLIETDNNGNMFNPANRVHTILITPQRKQYILIENQNFPSGFNTKHNFYNLPYIPDEYPKQGMNDIYPYSHEKANDEYVNKLASLQSPGPVTQPYTQLLRLTDIKPESIRNVNPTFEIIPSLLYGQKEPNPKASQRLQPSSVGKCLLS